MQKILRGISIGLLLVLAAKADVTLAALFQDHIILQRNQPVPVWGQAKPGERVTVEFRGYSAGAIADAAGKWQVSLPAMAASAEPAVLVVRGNNTLTISDVLTGDVWLASGQSNMEWRVEQANDAAAEIAAAKHPLIRQFDVANVVATSPQETAAGSWVVCSPDTAGKFSAVAYYFARDLLRANGVPVGIVNSSWGGTPVESWMSAAVLNANPAFRASLARWDQTIAEYPVKKAEFDAAVRQWNQADAAALAQGKEAQADFRKATARPRAPRGPGHHWTPAGLYNGMIAPLVPYALTGVIWYQGESNADYPEEYAALFTTMIRQWRAEWGRDLPCYFVQIANFNGNAADRAPGQWATLREAQQQALALPATGMAVTIDIGTADNIHPRNKQEVGRRLALLARQGLFDAQVEAIGPQFSHFEPVGTSLRLFFKHAAGLNAGGQPLLDFEVADSDRQFHPAEARLDGETVLVSSAAVQRPIFVRYAWKNAPAARLRNGAGLPAAPFRTDPR